MKRFGGAGMAAQAAEGVGSGTGGNQKRGTDKKVLKDKIMESVAPPKRYRTRK